MPGKDLKNKPLVEAILEARWELKPKAAVQVPGPAQTVVPTTDPNYKLLLGRLFDRLQQQYPVHEALPAADLPDDFVGHMVQHRFRAAEDDWPLVQVGPGIITVNETHKYTWTDFEQRTTDTLSKLFDAYPKVEELKFTSILLRYIDAVEFDHGKENVFDFLRDKLKVELKLPDNLFGDTGVASRPASSQWQAVFECTHPKGKVHVSFATGQKDGSPSILWETAVRSAGSDVPGMPNGFGEWVDAAHQVTDDWFFKLIEGDLQRRFEGE